MRDPSFRLHLSHSRVNPWISSLALFEFFNPFRRALVCFRISPLDVLADPISLDSREVVDGVGDRVEELAVDHLTLDSCAHFIGAVLRPVPERSWRNRSEVDVWARRKLVF